jgi:septal ring factor EnvC (AmiA/AmiB activator)
MLENIWGGLLINYHYLVNHFLQVMFGLFILFIIALFRVLEKIRFQQKQAYAQLLEQQQQIENIRYRLNRLSCVCRENRDKQRFISSQLNKIDDSIYEFEEQISSLKGCLRQQPVMEYFEPKAMRLEEAEL